MKHAIVILEDNHERREAMLAWLADRLPMYEHRCFEHPASVLSFLRARWTDVLVLSLDHDLNDTLPEDTETTGMAVVDELRLAEPAFPVMVHSSNGPAADKMCRRLKRAGWTVQRVIPLDDTSWIGNEWFPTLQRLLIGEARLPARTAVG